MRRRTWLWVAAVVVALLVACQAGMSFWSHRSSAFVAQADTPTVAPGADVLAGIAVIPARIHGDDYRSAAFGENWTDDNDAPLGHNGCDTRDDILDRDLVDKTYVMTTRCPRAVATGTLHDPSTNAAVAFVRGNKTGESVQIDHLVRLAMAWATWMPPNRGFWCQYAVQFADVLREYSLPIDEPSAAALRQAATSCPTS